MANLQDYAVIRELIQDVLAEGVEAGITADVREVVTTVERLEDPRSGEDYGVKLSTLARELGLDKTSAWRRVRRALKRGFLRNLEERKYRQYRLVIGAPAGRGGSPPFARGCPVGGFTVTAEPGGITPSPLPARATAGLGEGTRSSPASQAAG